MGEGMQLLLLLTGMLLSGLLSLLLAQVTGLRSDLKALFEKQTDMNERLITLETRYESDLKHREDVA
jgi:hypothetical protein